MANPFGDSPVKQSKNPFGDMPVEQAAPFEGKLSDIVTGRGAEAEETMQMPELQESGILSGEDMLTGAAVTPALLTATDPNEIAQIITTNFPNVGTTYQKAPDGSVYPVLVNNETGAATVINRPGISGIDIVQGLGLMAAYTPSGAASSALTTGLKAAGTGAAIEGAQELSGGDFDPVTPVIDFVLGSGARAIFDKFKSSSETKKRITELIEQKIPDVETAPYKLEGMTKQPAPTGQLGGVADDAIQTLDQKALPKPKEDAFFDFGKKMLGGQQKLKKDKLAIEAINQGFDEGTIAALKMASPKDKSKMAEMVRRMQEGKKNRLYTMKNRPSDVVGESLLERVRNIKKVNSQSGKQLDSVAKSLKGQQVDFDPVVDNFLSGLDDIGVKLDDNLQPMFFGSDIEGVTGAENVIKRIISRMRDTKVPDAYDLHRLKKYIDENVSYGARAEGLTGKAESMMKKLRSEIDGVLDSNFPKYDKVNTTYADTISALNQLQSATGKKMDFFSQSGEKALGTEMRKLLSNYRSRIDLLDSIGEIEKISTKYGGKHSDDLLMQTLFVDELNQVFGTPARSSFAGEIERGVKRGASAALNKGGVMDMLVDFASKQADKARGINEENAFKAINELLKGSK